MTKERIIRGTTRIVGVIGDPIQHSLSPAMHNASFSEQGLDWVYVPFHVQPDHLRDAIRGMKGLHITGLNVTIPHKEAVAPFLDSLTERARLIGAVNTIHLQQGELIGDNTDGAGFLRSLREEAEFEPAGKNILVVGAGGAARAIGVQLALEGAERVDFANRTVQRAAQLAQFVRQQLEVSAKAYSLSEVKPQMTEKYDAIVHTTAWGMAPNDQVPPLIAAEAMHPQQLIADIVYTPEKTSLLQTAEKKGCRTLPGLGMLVYQAALAYALWTKQDAAVDVMYNVLRKQLQRKEQAT